MEQLYKEHTPASANGDLMVAVYMITYNHEKFIAKAIDSVLMQKTNFRFKLFIGEDFSTDNTRGICIAYAEKYPDKISLRLNASNFLIRNSKATYEGCFNSGAKYMAMLEGDDYWTDDTKLQKQVDFLEKNPEFSFTGHPAEIWDEDKQAFTGRFEWKNDLIELKDAVFSPPIHTSSKLFRIGYGLPENFFKIKAGDDALVCWLAERGKGFFFREPMSVYRLSSAGTWSTLGEKEKQYRALSIQSWILKNYPLRYNEQARLVTELYEQIKDYKPLFSKHFTWAQKATLGAALVRYKMQTLKQRLKQKLSR